MSLKGFLKRKGRKKDDASAALSTATSLADRCALVLGECLSGMSEDVGEWRETVSAWPDGWPESWI